MSFKKEKKASETVQETKGKIQELDEDEIEELYSSRLQFDKDPASCNKKLLPNLANFITTDGFQKKKLELLFRRNTSNSNNVGVAKDIHNKNSLLVLLSTRQKEVIGGFTSIELEKDSSTYLSDENAFIFSLSKN